MTNRNDIVPIIGFLAALAASLGTASAAPKKSEPGIQLTEAGRQLEAKYAAELTALKAEIAKALPTVPEQKKAALKSACEAVKKATAEANAAQQSLGKIQTARALVDHAKRKWIGGAEKGIAQAEAALKKATTEAEREAAQKELAKWQANKQDGLTALKERQEALDKAKMDEPKVTQANQAAQAALAKARTNELVAAKALLTGLESFLSSDKLDAKLVKCTVLSEATPRGLAEFAQQGKEQEALVEKLLADVALTEISLVNGRSVLHFALQDGSRGVTIKEFTLTPVK